MFSLRGFTDKNNRGWGNGLHYKSNRGPVHTNRPFVHTKPLRTVTEIASFFPRVKGSVHTNRGEEMCRFQECPDSCERGLPWCSFSFLRRRHVVIKKQRACFSPLKVSSSNWTVSSAADVTQVSSSFGAVMGLLFMLKCFQSDVMLFWCLQLIIFLAQML